MGWHQVTESQLQARLLLIAPERLPEVRLFRRNVGSATLRGGYKVQFALPGQCDLYALARGGRHIEVELKAAGKRIIPGSDQDIWQIWCRVWDVPHIVLVGRKEESVEKTVERWCTELRTLF